VGIFLLFGKVLCKFGVGSAKIDLVLKNDTYCIGDMIKGEYIINGGVVEQRLKRVESDLVQTTSDDDRKIVIHTNTIFSSAMILAQEKKVMGFSFKLPSSLQPSDHRVSYKFITRLVFTDGISSVDHDEIIIQPD
jgi:sporulation-control protein